MSRPEATENVAVVTRSDEYGDTSILGVYSSEDDAKDRVREEAEEYRPDEEAREWVTDDEDHLLSVKKARRAFVAKRWDVE